MVSNGALQLRQDQSRDGATTPKPKAAFTEIVPPLELTGLSGKSMAQAICGLISRQPQKEMITVNATNLKQLITEGLQPLYIWVSLPEKRSP